MGCPACKSGFPANINRPPNAEERFDRVHAARALQVFRAVEDWCFELGKPAGHEEIPSVLALREPRLSAKDAEFELNAMRLLCGHMLAGMAAKRERNEIMDPACRIPSELDAPAWFANASLDGIQELSAKLASVSLAEMLGAWLVRGDALRRNPEPRSEECGAPAPFRTRPRLEKGKRIRHSSLRTVLARKA